MRHLYALIFLLFTYSAGAQSIFTSTGGGGNWTNPASWSENNQGNPNDADGIPDGNDDVIIVSGSPITINTSTGQNCENLTLTDGDLTFTIDASDLDVEGSLLVNGSATSTVTADSDYATDPRIDALGTVTINSGATLSIGQIRFDANSGATSISGTISFSTDVGVKLFQDITLESSGTWDNSISNEDFLIDGNIVQNGGTWNGCLSTTGCTYTMRATTSTISGSGTVEVSRLQVNTPDANTNNGTVRVLDDIRGTGTFTNGASGVVEFRSSNPVIITTATMNTVGSEVIYSGSTSQNMATVAHYDVTVNKDAATNNVQMNGTDITIDNDLTIQLGRVRAQSANTFTISNNVNISGANAEFEVNTTGSTVNIGGNLVMSNGNYDQNEGDVNITGDMTITGGAMNITNSNSTLDFDQLDLSGAQFTVAGGTVNATNGTGDGITLNANGFLLLNAATLNVTNNLNIANATAEFSPNNIASVANITGDLLMSAGLFDHNNGDVNVTGDITFTGGTMTMNEGTATSTIDAANWSVTDAVATLSEGIFNITGSVNANSGASNISVLNQLDIGTTLTSNSGIFILNNGADVSATDIVVQGGTVRPNNTTAVLDVTSDVTITSGQFDHNNGDVNISGDVFLSGTGLFTMNGSTSTVDATDIIISGGTMNLTEGTLSVTNASGGLSISAGIINHNGANTLSVTNQLSISGTGEYQPNNGECVANIGGNLAMSGGTLDHNDGDLNISGDLLITGGTMTMNEGDAPVNPSAIDATDMTVSNATVTLTEGTVTISNAAGGITVGTGGDLNMNGTTIPIAGDLDASGTGVIDMNSGTVNFVNMDLTTGGTAEIASPTVTSTGTITVDNGTMTINGAAGTYAFNNITVNTNGTWNTTAAYDPTINGNLFNDGAFTGCNGAGCDYTLTSTSGTISGSGAMNTMSDIILNDGASYTNTNSGGFNVTDGLETTSGTGTFINGINGVLSYAGTTGNMSITNFTASADPNTVIYNRTASNQLIEPTTDGFYHNLTIDKADAIDVTTNTVFTINGTLTLTAGDLIMGGQNLVIGESGSVSGGATTSYIQQSGAGRVIKSYPTSSFSDPLSIPFGDASIYAPMTFTLNSGSSVAASAQISFEFNNASGHPNRDNDNTGAGGDDDNNSGAAQATNYLNDYWEFDLTNISSPNFSATCDFSNGSIQGSTGSMFPVILRTGTPPMGSSTIDWHVVGTIADRGTGSVSSSLVTFTGINGVINTTNNWVLYAMDNADNGNGDERLPITLISFDARRIGDQVQLDWATADEENNDFFTIERSLNGIDFQTLMTVDGAGNSASRLEYSVIDAFPAEGRNYYRLKQTDFNGQFSYSEVRSVFVDEVDYNIGLSQNPIRVGDEVRILGIERLNAETELTFITYGGQVIGTASVHSIRNNGLRFTKPGLYLIKVADQGNPKTLKLIVR